jgi:NAD(P)H-flavin reductase
VVVISSKKIMPNFLTAKTISHNVIASSYHDFIFQTETDFKYQPGQYISVKVGDTRINSYSVAGSPTSNQIELLVDVKPGGVGSQYFSKLQVGENISFLGPFGKFVLNVNDGAEKMIFLGTGSGAAPLKCMIDAVNKQGLKKPMVLYFGLRHFEDLFWNHYFDQMQAEKSNFQFKMVLSQPSDHWQGVVGHITDLLKAEYKDLSKDSAYLCGNGKMIIEATELLKQLKMPESKIYFEKFF